jgi:hypothetical protein
VANKISLVTGLLLFVAWFLGLVGLAHNDKVNSRKKKWSKIVQRIIVTVEGGLVQGIQGIEPGTIVEVHDYDGDGDDPEDPDIFKDKDGDIYRRGIWSSSDYVPDSENGPR